MAGYRVWLQCSLSLGLSLALAQAVKSQDAPPQIFAGPLTILEAQVCEPTCCSTPTCKVYSLADLDDPGLCKWIAETIPEMIQPASWKQNGAKVSYYAPSKVLVINNTTAVHHQVEEFLQTMKKSTAQAKMKRDPHVLPAQFAPPAERVGPVQSGPAGYPVPYPPMTPKHLFHFIIRYEGEGIIDSNVVKFAKAMAQANATPGCQPPMVTSPPTTYAVPTTSLQPAAPPPPPLPSSGPPPFLPPGVGPIAPAGAGPMPPADAPAPVQPMPTPMSPPIPY